MGQEAWPPGQNTKPHMLRRRKSPSKKLDARKNATKQWFSKCGLKGASPPKVALPTHRSLKSSAESKGFSTNMVSLFTTTQWEHTNSEPTQVQCNEP